MRLRNRVRNTGVTRFSSERVPITAIAANGWEVTYPAPPTEFEPDSAPVTFNATRSGYSTTGATTSYTESLTVTKRIREAYPNQATLTASQAAINDYLYSTDSVNGVTNSSTETSPKPVANWAMYDRAVVGNTIPKELLEVVAFHRNARNSEQVACVEWRITDGTTTVTVQSSTSVVSGHAGDRQAVIVYRPASDVDISTLNDQAAITVNAKVYPWIGSSGSVLDSADSAVTREFSPRSFYKHVTRASTPIYAYVATTAGGSPTTSATAATAKANPYGTVYAAMTALRTATSDNCHGCIIRLMNGTHTLSGSATFATYAPLGNLIIERDPDEIITAVTLSFGSGANHQMRTPFVHVRNLQISRGGTFGLSNVTIQLFENCTWNNNSHNSAWCQAGNGRFRGVSVTNASSLMMDSGTNPVSYRGVSGSYLFIEGWLLLGCRSAATGGVRYSNSASRTQSGTIIAFNQASSISTTAGLITINTDTTTTGYVFAQNVSEYISITNQPGARLSADAQLSSTSHVIFIHNTFAGFFLQGRLNAFYNDAAAARTHKLMCMKGNIHVQINTKHDVFYTDGTRVQGWAYLFGVGCEGEFSQYIDADNVGVGGSFAQAYPGLRASLGTSNSTRNDPLFVDYEGTTSGPTAGAGGGDYRLQSGSTADGRVKPILRFDLDGTSRSTVLATTGAYEL